MIKIITYAARILSIIIIIFFAFFLTARNAPVLGDLSLIREIFTLIVTGITIVAWRIPMMGGVLFLLFGVRYFIMIARPGDIEFCSDDNGAVHIDRRAFHVGRLSHQQRQQTAG